MRQSVLRGRPFGAPDWQAATAARLGLGATLRPSDRPKKLPLMSPDPVSWLATSTFRTIGRSDRPRLARRSKWARSI
jgi:hypothetical protein